MYATGPINYGPRNTVYYMGFVHTRYQVDMRAAKSTIITLDH